MKIAIILGLVVLIVLVVMVMLRNTATEEPAESASPSSSVANLNWLQGAGGEVTGKTYHIGQRTVTIGRAPTNFVQIMDSNVSRFHVRLTPTNESIELQDMQSSIGVTVNDQSVSKITLKDGDTFSVGNSLFIYYREANYKENEGLARKEIGGEAIKPTMAEEEGHVYEELVLKTLLEHDGDAIKVSQMLNLRLEVVESIRAKHKA